MHDKSGGAPALAADAATAAALAAVADAAGPPPLVCTSEAEALCPGAVCDSHARAAFAGEGGVSVAAIVAVTDLGALDSEEAKERHERAVKLRLEEAR